MKKLFSKNFSIGLQCEYLHDENHNQGFFGYNQFVVERKQRAVYKELALVSIDTKNYYYLNQVETNFGKYLYSLFH